MADLLQHCCICRNPFHVQFSYQMEEHRRETEAGPRTEFRFYCSQDCLKNSHKADGAVPCDACGTAFSVTHAAHVLFIKAKRNYACTEACRQQLLAEARGVRLSQMLQPTPPAAPAPVARTAERETVAAPAPVVAGSTGGPRVIAVFNHKGGTGKTTTAVTVAAGIARMGKRCLLVDTDAQGNVAVSLGVKNKLSLYHVLVMGMPVQDAVGTARPNLDVLTANETLAAAELYLAGRQNRDRVLAARLAGARERYDYVVVDCSPSLSLLNQNALVFADAVLCPVACDYLSLVGVRQVVKTIGNVNRLLNHPVRLWGVLPTLYDTRARICQEALETLREHFGERCLAPVRSAIRVKEAPSQGQTLFEYAADSNAVRDYQQVVDQLLIESTQLTNLAAAG